MKHKMLLFLFICLFISCKKEKKTAINTAFYHWQTVLNISNVEQNTLDQLQAKKLYVKFFDVDWNGAKNRAVPTASVEIDTTHLHQTTIIPTIFITNRTFKNILEKDISDLATKVAKKIQILIKQLPKHQLSEIQIDCDWSEATQAAYWQFLELLRSEFSGITLSATIRLHQVKYFERTGIPPVDRGVLMFYNMGNLNAWESENSIIDLSIARQYFINFERYQLPLDIALPLFRWGVVYRDNEMVRLYNQLTFNDLSDTSRFIFLEKNRYEVKKSTYLEGIYLYKNDKIRLESCSIGVLQKAATELAHLLPPTERSLIFYHLEERVLEHYSTADLKAVINEFADE